MTLATSPALRSSYTVVDEAGKASSPGTVTVTVTKCDAVAPKLVDDNFAVGRNQTLKENFFDNDSAHDGTLTTSSLAGLTVDASAGSFTYKAGSTGGTFTFKYSVVNDCGVRSDARVTITVNRAPVANPTVRPSTPARRSPSTSSPTTRIGTATTSRSSEPPVRAPARWRCPAASSSTPLGRCRHRGDHQLPDQRRRARCRRRLAVKIEQPNRNPVARNDTAKVVAGRSVLISVLRNDSDPDGDDLILTDAFQNKSPDTGFTVKNVDIKDVRFTADRA
ncbi:MAG: Ig-like domain-containing protein [Ilumatobacteraceae bacterium]